MSECQRAEHSIQWVLRRVVDDGLSWASGGWMVGGRLLQLKVHTSTLEDVMVHSMAKCGGVGGSGQDERVYGL